MGPTYQSLTLSLSLTYLSLYTLSLCLSLSNILSLFSLPHLHLSLSRTAAGGAQDGGQDWRKAELGTSSGTSSSPSPRGSGRGGARDDGGDGRKAELGTSGGTSIYPSLRSSGGGGAREQWRAELGARRARDGGGDGWQVKLGTSGGTPPSLCHREAAAEAELETAEDGERQRRPSFFSLPFYQLVWTTRNGVGAA